MKKLIAIILASLVLAVALAGCGGKGEVHTPPSMAVEETTAGTEANDTKVTSTFPEDESKAGNNAVGNTDGTAEGDTDSGTDSNNDGNSQSGNAPSQDNDDLEIITYVPTQGAESEGENNSPDSIGDAENGSDGESATQKPTEGMGVETTEGDIIVLPFVPAE